MSEQLPPGMLLVLGALLLPLLPRAVRPVLSVALPLLGLLQVWMLIPGMEFTVPAFGYELELLRVDRLSKIFGIIFHIAALLSVIYALHVKDLVQQVCSKHVLYRVCAWCRAGQQPEQHLAPISSLSAVLASHSGRA